MSDLRGEVGGECWGRRASVRMSTAEESCHAGRTSMKTMVRGGWVGEPEAFTSHREFLDVSGLLADGETGEPADVESSLDDLRSE